MVQMVARIAMISILLVTAAAGQTTAPADGVAIARAAEAQVGVTVHYDPSYVGLDYPGGDVPIDRGVCTDVVIRGLRKVGVDLQVLLHEDMRDHFDEYPDLWGLERPDRNIDHRRVPNLMRWFEREGMSVGTEESYRPGDVVAWMLPSGLHHIGIVSTRTVPGEDRPLIVHNIGDGAQIEDILHEFEIIGHYRLMD